MSKTKISTVNYQSSFKFVLRARDVKGHELDLTVLDWKATFWTVTGGTTWEVSKIEGEMVNCRIKRGRVLVIAHNHKLPAGKLKCEIVILSPDEDFPGMQRRTVSPEHIDIELVPGKGDCECDDVSISAELEVPLVVQEKSIAGTIRPIEVPDKIMPYNARYGYAYRLKQMFGKGGEKTGGGGLSYMTVMKIRNGGDVEKDYNMSRLFPEGFLKVRHGKEQDPIRCRICIFHDFVKGTERGMAGPDYTDPVTYDVKKGLLTLAPHTSVWICLETDVLRQWRGMSYYNLLATIGKDGSVRLIGEGDVIRYVENIPEITSFSYSLAEKCFNLNVKYKRGKYRGTFHRKFEDQNWPRLPDSFIGKTKILFPFELQYLRFPQHCRYLTDTQGKITSRERPAKRCNFPKWTRTVRKGRQFGFFRIRYVSPRDKFLTGPWEYFFIYGESRPAKRVYAVTAIDRDRPVSGEEEE